MSLSYKFFEFPRPHPYSQRLGRFDIDLLRTAEKGFIIPVIHSAYYTQRAVYTEVLKFYLPISEYKKLDIFTAKSYKKSLTCVI